MLAGKSAFSSELSQSPSFLGHVVGKRGWLQIKPSGSGDENGIHLAGTPVTMY